MDRVAFFRNMVLDCFKMWSWHLDQDLNIVDTNCTNEELFGPMLLSNERCEILRAHAAASSMPLVISDITGMVWAAVFARSSAEDSLDGIYILGPILTNMAPKPIIEQLIKPLKLSIHSRNALFAGMDQMPKISSITFFQQITMLHYCVSGEVLQVSDLVYHNPEAVLSATEKPATVTAEVKPLPHSPLINEKELLDMVRTGNLDYHAALTSAAAASPGVRTRSVDPIQQAKYSVVAFIVLCSRAAIEGGLSSDSAYTLCDNYTESVDNCTTVSQIMAVSHTMCEDFIRRVNRCRNADGVSRMVQACRDYIDTHPSERITVEALAKNAGYTEHYMARRFKAETGISLNDYIRTAKLRQAKMLLTTTHLSIQEISDRTFFCSRTYFTDVFRKAEGMSPSAYREKYKNQ